MSLRCSDCGRLTVHGLECPCEQVLADEDRAERGGERDPEPYDPYELNEENEYVDD